MTCLPPLLVLLGLFGHATRPHHVTAQYKADLQYLQRVSSGFHAYTDDALAAQYEQPEIVTVMRDLDELHDLTPAELRNHDRMHELAVRTKGDLDALDTLDDALDNHHLI